MFFHNELLFNNAFLNRLSPSDDERGAMYSLVRSARDWYRRADFSTPQTMVDSFIRPLLQNQSLDLAPAGYDPNAYILIAPWDPGSLLGLMYITPYGEDLDGWDKDRRVPKGRHWMVKAVDRALKAGLCWTVLTNGACWRLLDANGLRRYEAYLEIGVDDLMRAEMNTPEFDLAAHLFSSLLRLEGAFARDLETGSCGLDKFLELSQKDTIKIERHLKQTVCDNLDTPGGGDGIMAQLCVGLVKAVDPQGTRSFNEAEREAIYRDATYLLYRLLFILYAEARGLLPIENLDYRPISLARLLEEADELRADPTRAAERPSYLWDSLAALFNFVDVGDSPTRVPAFDGGLFDNSEREYLRHYEIANTYLAPALYQLAYLSDPKTGLVERIDYRDLSVRHLGSLYEGMIEYRLFIAEEDLLARQEKEGQVRYLPVKGNQRKSTDELVQAGQVYFAQSPHERKATGTHYTAEELVEKLVRQTVLRLLDERWRDFEPQLNGWLSDLETIPGLERRAALQSFIDNRLVEFVQNQALSLRVCDPAMGSGHFLVHTAHQITNFILYTLDHTGWDNLELDLDPANWRRQVVESCLYGVDINPVAVELAKLSLWLATMQVGRPLSFLDHRLKTGNSLVGARFSEIVEALRESDLSRATKKSAVAEARGQYSFREASHAEQAAEEAVRVLDSLVHRDASNLGGVKKKKQDYRTVQDRLEAYRQVGNFITAIKMGLKVDESNVGSIARALEKGKEIASDKQEDLITRALKLTDHNFVFHWELEFPDIFFGDSGFNIVLGNPPFVGGSKISVELGDDFLRYLKNAFSDSEKNTDLSAYFFRKSFEIASTSSTAYVGLVSTNTISQGDTRVTGLAFIVQSGGQIIFADRFVKWPGEATVEVNLIAVCKSNSIQNRALLDGKIVPNISSYIDDLPEYTPVRLYQNVDKAFLGDHVNGTGFLLTKEEYHQLQNQNPSFSECLFPFLTGSDINQHPSQLPSRYVICFHDWTIDKAKEYPQLLQIILERVKPFRDNVKREIHKKKWWLFGDYRKRLRIMIQPLARVLVRAQVSDNHSLVFIPTVNIFAHKVIVFAYDDIFHFAILQSNLHELWLRRYTSTMRTDISYSPSDCFLTFPFPPYPTEPTIQTVDSLGQSYYDHRLHLMLNRQIGLTKVYNLFHNKNNIDPDIELLRQLHAQLDCAVLASYGWEDINLNHDFYTNDRKKPRFMPAPAAQRVIFTRLVELNQKIAVEEASQGITVVPTREDIGELED